MVIYYFSCYKVIYKRNNSHKYFKNCDKVGSNTTTIAEIVNLKWNFISNLHEISEKFMQFLLN